MSKIKTDLKIFHFNDGENHWLVAKDNEEAVRYFENDYLDDEQKKDIVSTCGSIEKGYTVEEITSETHIKVKLEKGSYIIDGIELLHIDIWQLLKLDILSSEIMGEEISTPYIMASSVY